MINVERLDRTDNFDFRITRTDTAGKESLEISRQDAKSMVMTFLKELL